jgi:Rrf2 family protein
MKISTKGTYGMISIMDIAIHTNSEQLVSVADIAARQKISKIYLEQVISNLRKANLLLGVKGPQGGYSLARPASEITVLEILEALEGNLFEISIDKQVEEDNTIADTLQKRVWTPMGEAINHTIKQLTLQDLVEDYQNNQQNYMFYI